MLTEQNRTEQNRTEQNRTEQNRTLEHCDFIKVVLMMLVLLHHSTLLWRNTKWFAFPPTYTSKFLEIQNFLLSGFRMYAFVLIAGFLYAYLKYSCGKYITFIGFLNNKLKRLIIPYAFISIIWVAPITLYYWPERVERIFKDYFLAIAPQQLWFLAMLFSLFMIVYFTMDKIYSNFWKGLAISLLIYALSFPLAHVIGAAFRITEAMRYYIFFWMGTQIYRQQDNFFNRLPSITYIMVYLGLLYFYDFNRFHRVSFLTKGVYVISELALHVVGALMGFYLLLRLAEHVNYKGNKLFKFLVANNIVIYAFHEQFVYIMLDQLNGKVSAELNAVANFVVALLGSMFIAWLLGKWKITRMLVGLK